MFSFTDLEDASVSKNSLYEFDSDLFEKIFNHFFI